MKHFVIKYIGADGDVLKSVEGNFTSNRSAVAAAKLYRDQLEEETGNVGLTFRVNETAVMSPDGLLCEVQPQLKKPRAAARSQKMFNFRIDFDVLTALRAKPNMGRFINDALREALQLGEADE